MELKNKVLCLSTGIERFTGWAHEQMKHKVNLKTQQDELPRLEQTRKKHHHQQTPEQRAQ